MKMHKKQDAHEANSVADVVNLPFSREEIIFRYNEKTRHQEKHLDWIQDG